VGQKPYAREIFPCCWFIHVGVGVGRGAHVLRQAARTRTSPTEKLSLTSAASRRSRSAHEVRLLLLLVAILSFLFDLEIAFFSRGDLVNDIGWREFVSIMLFLAILTVGSSTMDERYPGMG